MASVLLLPNCQAQLINLVGGENKYTIHCYLFACRQRSFCEWKIGVGKVIGEEDGGQNPSRDYNLAHCPPNNK